jgi:hypothetical protein
VYPGIQIELNPAEKALRGVVNKVTAVFERKGLGRFDKWKPAAVLRDRVTDSPGNVDASTLNAVEHIFEKINSLFAKQAS